jgi:hypothetical protein
LVWGDLMGSRAVAGLYRDFADLPNLFVEIGNKCILQDLILLA